MKIELKNLKVNLTLSEETYNYSATIYVDGQRAFTAMNHGHGGCDYYRPVKDYRGPSEEQINTWAADNYPRDERYPDLVPDLEIIVGDLINEKLKERELRSILRNKIVVLNGDQLLSYKAKPTERNLQIIRDRGQRVVNGDPQLETLALNYF